MPDPELDPEDDADPEPGPDPNPDPDPDPLSDENDLFIFDRFERLDDRVLVLDVRRLVTVDIVDSVGGS